MNIPSVFECNLSELKDFSKKLSTKTEVGDIYLLDGDLGSGKTTFARFFINALSDKEKIIRPDTIKSPSFPIMINYPFLDYEIYHYDLYRLKNKNELSEIGFFEFLEHNISIVEWPDLVINNFKLSNYYIIKFKFIDINKRLITFDHSEKTQLL